MKHPGAKEGKLCCFKIGNLGNRTCPWHELRICSQNAVNVGPDDYLIRIEGCPENRRREVRAAPAESCPDTFRGDADEACNNGRDSLLQQRPQVGFASLPN